jgi:hypothetical protein
VKLEISFYQTFYPSLRETIKNNKNDPLVHQGMPLIHKRHREQTRSRSETHNPKVGGSNPSPATNPSNKLQVAKRNLKTILDHIKLRFRVFLYNRIRRFYLQDHLNYIAVGLPLAVRHRPAVDIHCCLNAGVTH